MLPCWGFQDGWEEGAGGQSQHGNSEDVPGCAAKFAAFAHRHNDRAGEQADASSQDMQDQEREPPCPSLSPSTHAGWLGRPDTRCRVEVRILGGAIQADVLGLTLGCAANTISAPRISRSLPEILPPRGKRFCALQLRNE